MEENKIGSKNIYQHDSTADSLEKFVRAACSLDMHFTVYRLPQDVHNIYFQASFSPLITLEKPSLEDLSNGFIFSQFDGSKFFLHADISWNSINRSIKIRETFTQSDKIDQFLELLEESTLPINLSKNDAGTIEKSDPKFTDLVELAVNKIKNGDFEKIVPARSHLIKGYNENEIINSFIALSEVYPNAFISLFSSRETGTWLGATPEVLVKTQGDSIFETVALAGTQNFEGQELKNVSWTQKEIEEQALVSRYIINCFKKIRLREFDEHGPKTVIAGNLLHLKTTFHVNMKETNFPQLGSVMLDLLHPTSAVCGMPRQESLEFLKQNEDLDRRFYSGFLGPVNVDNQTNIFVNLRCLELTTEGVKLYAGAGVTEESDPQKELEETELKFDTLRKILFP